MLDVGADVVVEAVLADHLLQSIRVVHPPDQPRVRGYRDDRLAGDGEIFALGLGVVLQKPVHQLKQLHNSLVLAQILVALQQEVVLLSVTAVDPQLSRALLRGQHIQLGEKPEILTTGRLGLYMPGTLISQFLVCSSFGLTFSRCTFFRILQLLVDALVDLVVDVEGLAQADLVLGLHVALQPGLGLEDLRAELLVEGYFRERFGLLEHDVVQAQEDPDDSVRAFVRGLHLPGLADALVPEFLQQNCGAV